MAASLAAGGLVMAATKTWSGINLAALILGGVVIDVVDHGIYGLVTIRPLTVKNAKKVAWEKFKKLEPGFYFFHTIEIFLIASIFLSRFLWGKYFLLGYGVHLLMDGAKYRIVWKNWKWVGWWSVILQINRKGRT